MCGSSAPEDKSDKVAAIDAQRAREAQEEARRVEAEKRARFESTLSGAYSTAVDDAKNYFSSQGLDPSQYLSAISSSANSAKSRVPDLDGSPGTYFDNLGAQIYTREQDAQRSRGMRDIDTYAREGFAERRIKDESDDPFLQAILEDRYSKGDAFVRNLLDRGVVTNSGYEAARSDLDRQKAGAMSRLQTLGLAELERGRGNLRGVANTARTAANSLRLGDQFDPYEYSGEIDRKSSDFFSNLAATLEGSAPTDLFNTKGLAAIAGASQGAQNTAFNPDAFLGFGDTSTEEDDDEDEDEVVGGPIF